MKRRDFVKSAATAAAAFTIVPRHVLGGQGQTAPSDKLNIAGIGVGGMGKENLKNMAGENIVALCDVDHNHAAPVFETYPNAKTYYDFRYMLEKQKDIDAVMIATPDHTHAVATIAAMELGLHVYTQKPLTRLVSEARALTDMAKKNPKIVTQMGNQGHSDEHIRLCSEWINAGLLGDVTEVHAWSNRPVWPQGIAKKHDAENLPDKLAWDLWIGPSKLRSYNPIYHPFNWRGWFDFGSGALGDMGCHIIDLAYYSLNLDFPESVQATISTWPDTENNWEKVKNTETYPRASMVTYRFPKRGKRKPVTLTWYDGGLQPARPEDLEPERRMPSSGLIFVGDKGKLLTGDGMTRLIPEKFMKKSKLPEKTIPRIEVTHEQNWIDCCKSGDKASSSFDYAGPLTESVVLGNLAVKFPMEDLRYNHKKMEITNNADANDYIKMHYREGWDF